HLTALLNRLAAMAQLPVAAARAAIDVQLDGRDALLRPEDVLPLLQTLRPLPGGERAFELLAELRELLDVLVQGETLLVVGVEAKALADLTEMRRLISVRLRRIPHTHANEFSTSPSS